MHISLVLRCDGRRQYIEQSIKSLETYVPVKWDSKFIVNDAGVTEDPEYASWLDETFPTFHCIHHHERRGMAAGVRTAFETVLAAGADYCFATEDDFVITRRVPIDPMIRILYFNPDLSQLVLKRLPCSPEEISHGGQIEIAPDEYIDRDGPYGSWVEHDTTGRAVHVFSFNPAVVSSAAMMTALTASSMLERGVTDALTGAGFTFGYYGKRGDAPYAEHIGAARSMGYRY